MNKQTSEQIMDRRQALRNAGKGFTVYRGTKPAYRYIQQHSLEWWIETALLTIIGCTASMVVLILTMLVNY